FGRVSGELPSGGDGKRLLPHSRFDRLTDPSLGIHPPAHGDVTVKQFAIGVEGLDVGFVLVVPITTPPAAVVTAAVVDHSLAGFVDLSQTEHRFAAGGSGGAEQACGSETVAAFEPGPAQSVSTVFVVEEEHHPLRRCRIPAAPSRLDGCGE